MSPKVNWISGFKNGELDQFIPTGEEILLVGVDTEYTKISEYKNLTLSYQLAVKDCATGKYQKKIYYADTSTEVRLTLKELILIAFTMMGILGRDMNGYHIIFICTLLANTTN